MFLRFYSNTDTKKQIHTSAIEWFVDLTATELLRIWLQTLQMATIEWNTNKSRYSRMKRLHRKCANFRKIFMNIV